MSATDGKVLGVTKIVNHGPDASRWNVVILSEGYRSGELATFATDAQALADTLSTTAPFDTLWSAINVHRVDVESTDSGADDPSGCGGTGAAPATYFDATHCANNLARRLSVDSTLALSVAKAQVAAVRLTVAIVNSPKYGGSGGPVCVYSKAPAAIEIALHEMGHTAFGLADEYSTLAGCESGETGHDNYTGAEPTQINITKVSDRATIKWAAHIDAATPMPTTVNADCGACDRQESPVATGTVGAFAGAGYFHCGLYRPEFDCRMRTLGTDFCAVCSAAIATVIRPFLPASR